MVGSVAVQEDDVIGVTSLWLYETAVPGDSGDVTVATFLQDDDVIHAAGNTSSPARANLLLNTTHTGWTTESMAKLSALLVLIVVTLAGNSALIAVSMCHGKLRQKRVNVFLANLAAGDLMVCVVTMTTEILFIAFGGYWVLGPVACKLTVYGQIVTLASSTFLLTAMAMDRYQVLVLPLKSLVGPPRIWRKVALSWLLALVFASPQLFIFVETMEVDANSQTVRHKCRSKGYTAEWQRKAYFTFLTTYILVLPTAIMTYCYTNIVRVVWMRGYPSIGTVPPRAGSVAEGREGTELRFVFSRRTSSHKQQQQQQHQPSDYATASQLRPSMVAGDTLLHSGAGDSRAASSSEPSATVVVVTGSASGAPTLTAAVSHRKLSTRQSTNRRTSRYSSVSSFQPTRAGSIMGGGGRGVVSSSKRKVVVMTMSVIIGFLICETPYFVVGLIRIYSGYSISLPHLLSLAEIMAMAHSALNPILYFIFSKGTTNRACQRLCVTCQRRNRNRKRRQRQRDADACTDSPPAPSCCCCCCCADRGVSSSTRGGACYTVDQSSSTDDFDTRVTCTSVGGGEALAGGAYNGRSRRLTAANAGGGDKRKHRPAASGQDGFLPLLVQQRSYYRPQRPKLATFNSVTQPANASNNDVTEAIDAPATPVTSLTPSTHAQSACMRRAYSYCVRNEQAAQRPITHIPLDTYVLRQNGAVLWVNSDVTGTRHLPASTPPSSDVLSARSHSTAAL